MRISNTCIFFFVTAISFFACKKDSGSDPEPGGPDDCTIQIAPDNGRIIEGRYIVALNEAATGRSMSDRQVTDFNIGLLRRNNIRASALQHVFRGHPSGFIAQLTKDELNKLRLDANVNIIEPDRVVALGDGCFKVVEPSLITWNVDSVGYGDGTGKTAWIIDSGIDFTHPDLKVDTGRSRSFISSEPSANDQNGHGTHVAGIIGALNNRTGVLGVASGANLVALKTLDKNGAGTVGGMIQALAYINSNGKAGDVVNISVGQDSISNVFDQQVKNTAAKGILVAMAAGNNAMPASNYSPGRANASGIYTVSAVDSLDNFASFSNYGNDVIDFAAPGVNIPSTWIGGKYAISSGTSMASPHVAGLLLLVGNNIKSTKQAKNDPDGTPDPIAHK